MNSNIRQQIENSLTTSVCPECLKSLPARYVFQGKDVFLEKTCPEHGGFSTLIWSGPPDFETWVGQSCFGMPVDSGCPSRCGLCDNHKTGTCCVLVEVTQRCSLKCPVCFASSGTSLPDPSIGQLESMFSGILKNGGLYNLQLSGGEPTERGDLPDIIRMAKQMGFPFIQLNTNGLRIAREKEYIGVLRSAGLDCVFLQFDGVCDEVYNRLRGQPLTELKTQAVGNCASRGIGVVLVPVIAAGVNDHQVGAILDFALDRMPAVRGVHFQPVSYFGRCQLPQTVRYTIPHLLRDIEGQTGGRMRAAHFAPANAENPRCSFSGRFMLNADGSLVPMRIKESCCNATAQDTPISGKDGFLPSSSGFMSVRPEQRERAQVARRWSAAPQAQTCCCEKGSMDEFVQRAASYTLSVSCMAFMDAYTLDCSRLHRCHVHVAAQDNRLIPFCAYNLSANNGRTLYR